MQIPVYHVDEFTDKSFSGNPAASGMAQMYMQGIITI